MSAKEWTMSATISPDDFRSSVKEMFNAADANQDGVLVLDEFKQFSLYLLQSMTGLQLAESKESIDQLFQRFDKNKDGKLDWSEIWAAVEPIQTKIQSKKFSWEAKPGMSADDFKKMVKEMFDVADENKD